jgi:hypothetical protein
MKCPAEVYSASCRPYLGIPDPHYPFHDRTVVVTSCGRICLYNKKINLSVSRQSESKKLTTDCLQSSRQLLLPEQLSSEIEPASRRRLADRILDVCHIRSKADGTIAGPCIHYDPTSNQQPRLDVATQWHPWIREIAVADFDPISGGSRKGHSTLDTDAHRLSGIYHGGIVISQFGNLHRSLRVQRDERHGVA